MDDMFENLYNRKSPTAVIYVLLILLYYTVTFVTSSIARSDAALVILGNQMPVSTFTGVFSAIGNICIIFLVVFYRKTGYLTAVFLLLTQFPMLLLNFFVRHNPASIPGMFANLFTIIAITIIFLYNSSFGKFQRRIRQQAVTDSLTGLPNRFACDEIIEDLIRRKVRFALVSADLNNFKYINDTMGHEVGNRMLKEIADRWKALAGNWSSDTVDYVVRLGGDEFAVIIRGYKDDKDIVKTIKKFRDELEKTITIDDCDYYMTASFGYAKYPEDTEKSSGLSIMSCADAALHKIKRAGLSVSEILHFEPDQLDSEKIFEIERKVRTAIEEDTILCFLQPQYDMDHKLYGFEALARMKDSAGYYISPGEFIPVAERAGFVDKVDLSVFKKAAIFLAAINEKSDTDINISFNISVRHLMKKNFVDEIRAIVEETGVPADHLEIEITESVMIDSADKALERINDVKKMGIKIAIDDFGTGYSSLSYLGRLPADMLKIDKSFIDVMNASDASKHYVESIISIGHVMGMKVISEGVETEDQLVTLKDIGCDYIQGYIWGHPMSVEEAEKLV